jgi:butyryl-CoA dehydrogenase
MSKFLTEEQELMRNVAREFAQKEVEPRAVDIDKKDEFPADLVKRAAELNFFGLMIPEEYGGLNSGITTTCVVLEEIAKASPALAGLLSVQIALCPAALNMAGTEEQKQRFLVPSAKGEKLMALSSTEPSGAANMAAHQTRLTADGDGYRLNGLKIFCSQGSATVYLVGAKTSEDGTEGYGEVIVEQGMPGFEIGKYEEKLGWRGSQTGTLLFKDVYIPKENVIGSLLGGNMEIGLGNLMGNLGHCASSLGCAEGLFDKTVAYVKQRTLYNMPMAVLQPMSYWLADSYTKIEACRSLLYTTTRMFDEYAFDPTMVMSCKAYICETVVDVCNKLLQMWGGNGMMNDVGVNRYLRDARTNTVAEGASEMMLSFLAQSILS